MITGGSSKNLREYALDAMIFSKLNAEINDQKKPQIFNQLFFEGDPSGFSEAYETLIAEIALEIDRNTSQSGDIVLKYVQKAFKELVIAYPKYARTHIYEVRGKEHYPPFTQYMRAFIPLRVEKKIGDYTAPPDYDAVQFLIKYQH